MCALVDFSNILKKETVEKLAEVDVHEVVTEVQEYYGDFYAINTDLYSLNISKCSSEADAQVWEPKSLQRCVEGLFASLLSLKKRPAIRFEKSSVMAMRLAQEVQVRGRVAELP